MKLVMKKYLVTAFSMFAITAAADATVRPSSLFSHHMILQKGVAVPVWGRADEGEKVVVKFNGQVVSTVAKNGKWMVKLAPMPYITTPQEMTITGQNTISIKDVLVGEVWLCSGQSNMERQLGPRPPQQPITDWEKERDAANYPMIREYYVPLKYAAEKVEDVQQRWTVCSPQTVSDFSAVGYFFARELYKRLNIPVGIIFSAYGGTPAEDWTSKPALEGNPQLAELVKNYDKPVEGYRPAGKLMSGLYNGMIAPLIPYAIKGVAWYQGEANRDWPKEYQVILPNMIRNWRTDFGQGDFPFLIVQIAPYKDMTPEIREAQLKVSERVKNTALIVTTDCGDANDIHPTHKQPVGERLGIAACGLAYHQKIAYSGPLFASQKINGNDVVLNFSHTAKGLRAKDNGTLSGFTIAGADKKFVPATAEIRGNTVVVHSASVSQPVAVRYGWANVPECNLYNSAGLPASPFRTDSE
ncbi:sialate O-acetylesterase [Chitinophaga sp. S165]|uniref:sialate O-acetylesterase n=1 Tax=Chitinophaga sp. S165 TaxID=2135462 RepID=UPI000D92476F|nr:sialate O-acetylesterase [Chitinophaga sp. S165]PWV49062.1 sialate O-acetylesterase [Chitinophaga sp. S165]